MERTEITVPVQVITTRDEQVDWSKVSVILCYPCGGVYIQQAGECREVDFESNT